MPYEPLQPEVELVQECLKGNPLYQKKLFEKYYGKMLGACQRYANNSEEAQDILQDGFIKIFQNLGSFNFNCPLEAWIRRIMVNTAIDKYRKAASEPDIFEIESARELSDSGNVMDDLNHSELLTLISKMPTGYRIIFNMHVVEGYSHKEIGEELDITEGTSKSQLVKAKLYLQKMITREYSANHE
jgi:RNA polymerase sigma factor (sigma-70 family)